MFDAYSRYHVVVLARLGKDRNRCFSFVSSRTWLSIQVTPPSNLAIAFLVPLSVALVLRSERPPFGRRPQEHLTDPHPVAALVARQKTFYGSSMRNMNNLNHRHHLPSSSRLRYAGGRSFIFPGNRSSNPIGTYRYVNESASHKKRRVWFTP